MAVTTPLPRKPRPPIVLHHSRSSRDGDHQLLAGIPATSLPRTLLDIAAQLTAPRLASALERCEELELFDLVAVEELLARSVGHAGVGRLRRALDVYRPQPITRSSLERRFLGLVEATDLPRPSTAISEAGYELDVYWPEERFVVELDVYETHGTRAAFERDRLRQEDLKLAGVEMMRVTGPRLDREPEAVLDRLTRLLAQRRRQLGA